MRSKRYLEIVAACEACLEKYGDSYLGVGWTKRKEDADTRHRVMLEAIQPRAGRPITLLDFGCGASHLYEYILAGGLTWLEYSGLDLSPKFVELSRRKFPSVDYYNVDILDAAAALPEFDYVIMNGVFTWKCGLDFEQMFTFFQDVVRALFGKARIGIAFNVMSKQVDWERDDLFHLPIDMLASFLAKEISRHFVVRHDYGLYEYTTYVYRYPMPERSPAP